MTLKIDLEKTYNKLEWSFVRDMLICFNIPGNLINLTMSCISPVSTLLLFNGGALEHFLPTRGIRQGNPLSPYMFIMCMDYLGQLIQERCEDKSWIPIKASRRGPAFSHLFLADDLVLFTKANMENCLAVREVLMIFAANQGRPLVKQNPGYSFPQMWTKVTEKH